MAVRYSLVNSNTDFPTNAASTFNSGFNIAGGPIESIIFRFQGTVTAANIQADFPGCVSQLRLTLNGESFMNYQAGYTLSGANAPSQLGYFLNSMSDDRFSSEVITSAGTAKDAYIRVPVGRQAPPGVSRLEYTLQTAALAAAGAGTCEVWIVYNDAAQTSTFIGNPTSLTASGTGQEEIVVRLPSNVPGVVAGILVQNDRATAADITGFRIVSQSDWSMDSSYWRFLNGDLQGGVVWASEASNAGDPAGLTGALAGQQSGPTVGQSCVATYFLPTLGLSRSDDVRMQITTAAARVVTFTPVLVAGFNASEGAQPSQTQRIVTNTSRAILDTTGQADA
jgi:hypothetical protein